MKKYYLIKVVDENVKLQNGDTKTFVQYWGKKVPFSLDFNKEYFDRFAFKSIKAAANELNKRYRGCEIIEVEF